MEHNTLVASGEFARVYVCELEPGDVLATGETVAADAVRSGLSVWVEFVGGAVASYGRADTTVLVRQRV